MKYVLIAIGLGILGAILMVGILYVTNMMYKKRFDEALNLKKWYVFLSIAIGAATAVFRYFS